MIKLWHLGTKGEPAMPYLIRMLGSEVEFPRHLLIASSKAPMTRSCSDECTFGGEAAERLARIGKKSDELLVLLKSRNWRIRANAVRAVGGLKDRRAIGDLLRIAQQPTERWEVRGNALLALGLMRERSAESACITALKDEHAGVRMAAAEALGQLVSPEGLEPLRLAVHDPDPRVRRAAVGSLGEFKEEPAAEAVIGALEHDSDRTVREVAAAALRKTGDDRAVPVLIGALKDEYANVQINAATALGELGRREALEPLLRLLGNKNEAIRAAAAGALGDLGDPRAAPGLIAMVRVERWEIPLTRGLEALSKLGDLDGKAAFEEFLRHRPDWKEWWSRNKLALLQPEGDFQQESSKSGSVAEFRGFSLANAPRHTDFAELPDLFHALPAGSKSYEIRPEVRPVYLGPDGTVYHIPSKDIFYVQHDPPGSSTLTYYGPFKGDPRFLLNLQNTR